MENKRLNFDQPLLSARRCAAALPPDGKKSSISHAAIPQILPYRSQQKSGPVRNPGTVPFLWEQTPGNPKEATETDTPNHDVAPKLPPGRLAKAHQPECSSTNTSDRKIRLVNVPCAENDEMVDTTEENASSQSEDSSTYVDALDTLSRTESFFLNCSMSGLSELQDLDAEKSGRFFIEPDNRLFMMDRFLPAAKVMASETTPHYEPKKLHEVQEQPKKKVQHKPLLRYGPSFAKRYYHYQESEEVDSNDEDDDDYQCENSPAVCGLLPRFCLLNPFPAMSVRTRATISSSNKLHPRHSSADSYTKHDNESRFTKRKLKSEDGTTALPQMNGSALQENRFKTFQELLDSNEPDSGADVVEKNVCVNSIQKRWISSSDSTQDTEELPSSRGENQIFTKSMDQINEADSTNVDLKNLDGVNGQEKSLHCTHELKIDSMDMVTAALDKEAMDGKEKKLASYSQAPAPPPLPKSPSDSWLVRTLPSMSTKNSSKHSYLGTTSPQRNGLKTPNVKWETIVKTTKSQHPHLHYSRGLLKTIPEA